MRKAFALQKLLTFFFNKKYWHNWNINVWNFKVSLTNDVVSFEQLGPDLGLFIMLITVKHLIFVVP